MVILAGELRVAEPSARVYVSMSNPAVILGITNPVSHVEIGGADSK